MTEGEDAMNDTEKGKISISKRLEMLNVAGLNVVFVCGCVLVVIASFMPYVHSDQKTMSLMEGTDGIFFLIFTVLIFIFIAFNKEKIVGILGLVMVYFGVYELLHTYGIMSRTGQVVTLKAGYFVLLAGTVVLLAGGSYFVYCHGLKDLINRVFDRFFPLKGTKEKE